MSADWLPTVAAFAGIPPTSLQPGIFGEDRSGDFDPTRAPAAHPRSRPIAFDYRADGYGACWNQAPRLAIIKGDLKLLLTPDGSRLELYNRSGGSGPFEAGSVAHQPEYAAHVATLKAELLAWEATLDPIQPGTMGDKSRHLGCLAYRGVGDVGVTAPTQSWNEWRSQAAGVADAATDPTAMYRI
jgi:arylsulfatase A-like enzyme